MNANELLARIKAAGLAKPGARITSGRACRHRDAVADIIRPHVGETLQWLCHPRTGESERAYARRAVAYAEGRCAWRGGLWEKREDMPADLRLLAGTPEEREAEAKKQGVEETWETRARRNSSKLKKSGR